MKKWTPLFFVLALVVTGAFVTTAPAISQPRIIQTGCDTLSFVPPLVHVKFAVLNLGSIPICSVHLTPIVSGSTPPESCKIIECSVPTPGWICQLDSTSGGAAGPSGGASWYTISGAPCIQFGEKVEPFDVILDPLFCCYRAEYDDGNGNIFYIDTVCFECDKPVPIKPKTWGFLKQMYR